MLDVTVVVRGVERTLNEHQLLNFADHLSILLGASDPAPVFWPLAEEIGVQFQITEEKLGELLQPVESSQAA